MVLYRDFFTGTSGSALTAHTPDPDGIGGWENGNNGNAVISNQNRVRAGSAALHNVVLYNQIVGQNSYGVSADYIVKSVDVDGGVNDVHSGLVSHGTTGTPGRRMNLTLVHNGTNVYKVKVAFRWEGAEVLVGQVTGLTWVAGQTGRAKLEMIAPTSGNIWTVKAWVTRTDGQYLKPDGSFQVAKVYAIDSTFDSTPMITNGTPMPMAGQAGFTFYANVGDSTNIHWDNFEIDNLVDASLVVSPSSVANNSTTTLTLTGTGTNWLTSTPSFTVSGGTKNSQAIVSNTSATISFTAPAGAGSVTITDPSTGASTTLTIVLGIIVGTVTALDNDGSGTIRIQGTAPSGTGTVTRTLKRHTDPLFPTPGTTIASSTSSGTVTWLDSSGVADTPYFYREVYVDSATPTPNTANSNMVGSCIWQEAMTIGGFGDSLTQQGYFINQLERLFKYSRGPRRMGSTGTRWKGIGGSKASEWTTAGAYLNSHITDMQAAGVTDCFIMLGTNWEATPPNTALYQSSMTNIVNAVVAAGMRAWLFLPPTSTNEFRASYVLAYHAVLRSLDNGTTIRCLNDKQFLVTVGGYALGETSLLSDGVHYGNDINGDGGRNIAGTMYQAWDAIKYGDGAGSSGSGSRGRML